MSDTHEVLKRTNELLEQLLELEEQKSRERQTQMQSMRDAMRFELPKLETFASDAMRPNPDLDSKMQELKQEADARHEEELAFRDRLVSIMDEQTALLETIAMHLRR